MTKNMRFCLSSSLRPSRESSWCTTSPVNAPSSTSWSGPVMWTRWVWTTFQRTCSDAADRCGSRLHPLLIFLLGNAPAVRTWEGPEDPRREQVRWGGKEAGGYSAGHQGIFAKNIYRTFTFFHKNKRHFWNRLQSSTKIYNIFKTALIPIH